MTTDETNGNDAAGRVSDEDLLAWTRRADDAGRLARELIESRAELKEQREAARYRQHLPKCAAIPNEVFGTSRPCTCGYDSLPERLKGTT